MKTNRLTHSMRMFTAVAVLMICATLWADVTPGSNSDPEYFDEVYNGIKLRYQVHSDFEGYVNVMGFADAAGKNFEGELVIPATITHEGKRYTIFDISGYAFYYNGKFSSVVIKSVHRINESAFDHLDKLQSVTIESIYKMNSGYYPEGGINRNAFFACNNLMTVTLPRQHNNENTPYFIHQDAFVSGKIKSFTVTNSNPSLKGAYYSSNDVLFLYSADGQRMLYMYPETKTQTSYTIPSNVTSMRYESMSWNGNLKTVVVPEGFTEIPSSAFRGCTNLENVTLPRSLKKIDQSAFNQCSSLTSIKLPYQLEEIRSDAFSGTALTDVVVKNPTVPICDGDAFDGIESQIHLYVPVGSDYAQWEPWSRMTITETNDVYEKYGISVAGIDVNEVNYNDVLGDGTVKFRLPNILTMNNATIYVPAGKDGIVNSGVDDLIIQLTGTNKIISLNNDALIFEKPTTLSGDLLLAMGMTSLKGSSVYLFNKATQLVGSKVFDISTNLTVSGLSTLIATSMSQMGTVKGLSIGSGNELIALQDGHTITYDATTGYFKDNGQYMTGEKSLGIGVYYPLYYNGNQLSSVSSLLTDEYDVIEEYDEEVPRLRLRGTLNATSTNTVFRSEADNLIIELTGNSELITTHERVTMQLKGNTTICGEGKLTLKNQSSIGTTAIWMNGPSTLTLKDIDYDMTGRYSIYGAIGYSTEDYTEYVSNVVMDNVSGTMYSPQGASCIIDVNNLTCNGCYFLNHAQFNSQQHIVPGSQLQMARGEDPNAVTTAIEEAPRQEITADGNEKEYYDLQGRRVMTPEQKGIYISNGRKVIVR